MPKRPLALGFMGPPKAGKTNMLVGMMQSSRFDPKRCLYLDNHGSTDMYDMHQWTVQEPWGVKHIASDSPDKLVKEIENLNKKFKKMSYPYDAIAIDDWSEFAQSQGEALLDEMGEGALMRVYGELGTLQRRLMRHLLPRNSHAALFISFWSAQEPDPQEARPSKVEGGVLKYTADTRKTKLRPFLKGAFGGWYLYKLDGLFYQYMEEIRTDPKRKGELEFYLQLAEDKHAAVFSRWQDHYADGKRSRVMENPSLDKLLTLIEELDEITKNNNKEVQ